MANTLAALRYSEFWKSAAELAFEQEEALKLPPLIAKAVNHVVPGGLPRGSMLEVRGSRSQGCTSLCLEIVAQATRQGEVCAVIDPQNSFQPASAAAIGVNLERLVWTRCIGNLEAAIRACDLLLHAGGFGIVYFDLCEADSRLLQKLPVSYWYRFRRAIEHTPTILLISANVDRFASAMRPGAVVLHADQFGRVIRPFREFFTRHAHAACGPSFLR